MNEKAVKLIWQMVLSTMGGRKKRTWDIYEQYVLETRLHVPVREYTDDDSTTEDRRCGTCARWESKPGEHGLPRTYCNLDRKERFSHEGKGCLGWKERKV